MKRSKFSSEFKLEAVKLVRERSVSVAQAVRDLDIHENVLRKWVGNYGFDSVQAFPGHGQMKPEQLEIVRLSKEVAKLKAERDILKNRSGLQPACARYKQLMLRSPRRAVADGLLVGWTPLKNVAHGPMRT